MMSAKGQGQNRVLRPFPARASLKNLCSSSSRGLDRSGVKQNLQPLISNMQGGREWNLPNGVKLVCYFRGPCTFSYKGLDFYKLAVVSCLESGGVVKDELRIAHEDESTTDVMDPTLSETGIRTPTQMSKSIISYPCSWLELFLMLNGQQTPFFVVGQEPYKVFFRSLALEAERTTDVTDHPTLNHEQYQNANANEQWHLSITALSVRCSPVTPSSVTPPVGSSWFHTVSRCLLQG